MYACDIQERMVKMNKGEMAILFLFIFLIGGLIGTLSLPEFSGRFFISGFVIAVFALGFGRLIIHWPK